MRRTKIVATIGPASSDEITLTRLLNAGVDVFRLNFSHGTRESHRDNIHRIRQVARACDREVAILQDLCGPKIRTGTMENGAVELIAESEVTITTRKVKGTGTRFSTSYKALPQDVSIDSRILLDDGNLELTVLSVSGDEVRCRVVQGGTLRSRKGMNLPGTAVSTPSVTQKDVRDLVVGLEEGVDFVALSFVRHPDDIRKVRRTLEKHGKDIQIIAKIEKPEAIEHIEEIIYAADGIMVARGDLGVEMAIHRVPVLQKDLIRRANEADKYVITATQMLDSMMQHAMPTRAEVADVANAIIDGSDAVMLSGETAAGKYPVESVRMIDAIARETETHLKQHRPNWNWDRLNPINPVQDALGHAAFRLYQDLDVKAVCAFSATGGTALFLSKSRPFAPIIAFSARRESCRRMRLWWGVEAVLDSAISTREELRQRAIEHVLQKGLAEDGDRILVVAGTHFGQVGSADGVEIATVGEIAPAPTRRSPRRRRKK